MEEKEVVADTDSHSTIVASDDNNPGAGDGSRSAYISICIKPKCLNSS